MQDLIMPSGSAFVETWSQTLVDASIRGTLLLIVAFLLTVALRRSSAARRHLVWTVALASLLALPALSAVLPEYRVLPEWMRPVPEQARPVVASNAPEFPPMESDAGLAPTRVSGNVAAPRAADASAAAVEPGESTTNRIEAPAGVAGPVNTVESPERGWRFRVGAVWLTGAALLLLRLMAGRANLQRLVRSGWKPRDRELAGVIDDVREQLHLRRRPVVCICDRRTIPMTWGIVRQYVLLPREAERWSHERLRMVLLHEFGHIRRHDTLTHVMTQITAALYWFHPLVWLAVRRVRLEREHACDDLVLQNGVKATEYADDLAEIVVRLKSKPGPCPALGMVHRSQLEDRIMALFDESRNRKRVTGRLAALVCGLAVAGTMTLAAVHAREPAPAEEAVQDSAPEGEAPAEDIDGIRTIHGSQPPEDGSSDELNWSEPQNGLQVAHVLAPAQDTYNYGAAPRFQFHVRNISTESIHFYGWHVRGRDRAVVIDQYGREFTVDVERRSVRPIPLRYEVEPGHEVIVDAGEFGFSREGALESVGRFTLRSPVGTYRLKCFVELQAINHSYTVEYDGSHDVVFATGETTITVSEPQVLDSGEASPDSEPGRTDPQPAWGAVVDGLQVGVTLKPGGRDFRAGDIIHASFRLRNTSETPVRFSTSTFGRDLIWFHNGQGEEEIITIELRNSDPRITRYELQSLHEVNVGSLALGIGGREAHSFDTLVHWPLRATHGRNSVQFVLSIVDVERELRNGVWEPDRRWQGWLRTGAAAFAVSGSRLSSSDDAAGSAEPTSPRAVVDRFLEQLVIGKQTINGIRGSMEHAWRYTTREEGWSVEMMQLARQPAFRAVAELGNDRQVMVLTGTARTGVSSVQDRVGVFELVRRDGVWLIQAMDEYQPEHAWLLAEGFQRGEGIEWILEPEDFVGRYQAGIFDGSEHTFEADGKYTISRPGDPATVGTWQLDGDTLVRMIDGEEMRNRVARVFDGGFSIEFGERSRAGYYRIRTEAGE